eukprot:Clim_evm40s150 gene=Clim_evmTU40s150
MIGIAKQGSTSESGFRDQEQSVFAALIPEDVKACIDLCFGDTKDGLQEVEGLIRIISDLGLRVTVSGLERLLEIPTLEGIDKDLFFSRMDRLMKTVVASKVRNRNEDDVEFSAIALGDIDLIDDAEELRESDLDDREGSQVDDGEQVDLDLEVLRECHPDLTDLHDKFCAYRRKAKAREQILQDTIDSLETQLAAVEQMDKQHHCVGPEIDVRLQRVCEIVEESVLLIQIMPKRMEELLSELDITSPALDVEQFKDAVDALEQSLATAIHELERSHNFHSQCTDSIIDPKKCRSLPQVIDHFVSFTRSWNSKGFWIIDMLIVVHILLVLLDAKVHLHVLPPYEYRVPYT